MDVAVYGAGVVIDLCDRPPQEKDFIVEALALPGDNKGAAGVWSSNDRRLDG